MNEDKLLETRIGYTWDWFAYHANQRIMMFNYFLVVSGILATAYVALLKEGPPTVVVGLGVVATFVSIGFISLESRNRQMVIWGEDILAKIEEESIFSGFSGFTAGTADTTVQLGLLYREKLEDRERQELRWPNRLKWPVRHGIWIPLIEGVIAFSFFLAALLPITSPHLIRAEAKETAELIRKIDNLSARVDALSGALESRHLREAEQAPTNQSKAGIGAPNPAKKPY